eukprot:TRINITY_DN103366_c0_g1_i1.p1 TRINITY_DN103366_c0_g1~~TRINITY_DN103366_c0_g1_i1.p1  ORF type:complete len:271 (-),score=22.62 TRINITY_DN103366_c0_g1_i1:275-1087(-)
MAPPIWVQDLLNSGLLTEIHKFSKFIHGTSVLMSDMVQAVPYWIDDVSVRDSIQDSAPFRTHPNTMQMGTVQEDYELLDDEQYDLRHPLLGDVPRMSMLSDNKPIKHKNNIGNKSKLTEWIDKVIMSRNDQQVRASQIMRLEPKTFFASERTMLAWLHMAVTIGAIAAALLGYAASVSSDKQYGLPSIHIVEVISLILLPVAVIMTGYALMTYVWRGRRIMLKQAQVIDDRVGPTVLALIVVMALLAIFVVSLVDLVRTTQAVHQRQQQA